MYGEVNKEMKKEIFNLANSNRYEEAKDMRSRLTTIRKEFDSLQTTVVKTTQKVQTAFLEKAIKEINSDLSAAHYNQSEKLFEKASKMEEEQRKTNEIQWDNLERKIAQIPQASVKYSKRAIELLRAENGLIKLNQYDDARKVRMMLDRILPGEQEMSAANFDAKIESMRRNLRELQAQKDSLLIEKLKGAEWTNSRKIDRSNDINALRIRHHTVDMNHSHCMEEKLRPEMSVKPSALWQKRKGHDKTSSSLRGQQLLNDVRNKRTGEQDNRVFAESLVDRHNFHDVLDGTITRQFN